MAHNNTEIEIKIPITEEIFSKLKKELPEMAQFEKTSKQVDTYYSPSHRDFLAVPYPYEWLRIGQRGGKTILNYKHYYPENVPVFTHCDELETVVDNPENLEKLFTIINLKKLVTVKKIRETYSYRDEFEIVLDSVEELGYFVEIETKKDFGSVERAREKLFAFAKQLGIDPKTDKRGYPYLLMDKKGLIKK